MAGSVDFRARLEQDRATWSALRRAHEAARRMPTSSIERQRLAWAVSRAHDRMRFAENALRAALEFEIEHCDRMLRALDGILQTSDVERRARAQTQRDENVAARARCRSELDRLLRETSP